MNGVIASWIGKLRRLNYLDLDSMNIGSQITFSFANLSHITFLRLQYCNLSGEIPSWIMNLTNLAVLRLTNNYLQGQIHPCLFELENLKSLSLFRNLLGGELALSNFLKLKRLTDLCLSDMSLSKQNKISYYNVTLHKFRSLYLISCNLNEFPPFLQDQHDLEGLDLQNTSISGSLPRWLWTMKNLLLLEVSNNLLTGEISSLICNLKSLEYLDMPFNNLSGTIPICLGSSIQSLKVMLLQSNKFSGLIPQAYHPRNALLAIDFSRNNLQGQLPKALVNCKMLEYLVVSNNQINDSFPFWLGALPELKVLSLCCNKFYGTIRSLENSTFLRLHIIDLSHNDFLGNFPSEVIWKWKYMRSSNADQLQYELMYHYFKDTESYNVGHFPYSFTMFKEGNIIVYEKLQKLYFYIAIDISSNKFVGEIPHAIGELKRLVLLNLSNDMFTGAIPSSLEKLSQLETLDLSHNSLSGRIPEQLVRLTVVETLDVSYNHLIGPIPQIKPFTTFQSSSFEGNQGLCGNPLSKKCGSLLAPPSRSDQDQKSRSLFDFGWKVVLVGYGCGLVVGVVIGSALSLERYGWLRRIYKF